MQRRRFIDLWKRNISAPALTAEDVFEKLSSLYSQPHRHYHDSDHINTCLQWFDRYSSTAADADAVELAIWFHDACYGVNPKGHEAESAALFRECTNQGVAPDRQERICRFICATTHQTIAVDQDEALVVDIDLASFARPWAEYLRDTILCRKERSQLEELEFCHCQTAFLRSLLARTTLYYSVPFRQYHEQQARDNIKRLIELLQSKSEQLA